MLRTVGAPYCRKNTRSINSHFCFMIFLGFSPLGFYVLFVLFLALKFCLF
ncbi:hypothetical protein HanRHA438_Chr11g0528111 [Helianthus annuus]|uniref:Uncharacterized protein n=1 Tax=Helianthus annuus TaxID=4232 RepID=A0A9K3HT31_HELAN|nr:hypothetical protein HanXRQr2_Chr11g0516391 [Helianthus annuus]KAJ0872822.1 hypothetical protein HanRHA438_Chr11g0528111 [Helianthus annuus]KAJ0877228.1 hypothetical protein HanPSC8_Chr11g0497681 [Helianthus annuus]